jgi:hypothetical protein
MVAPLFEPPQVHDHGPFPVTTDGVPCAQRSVVGADEKLRFTAKKPQSPFTGTVEICAEFVALQEALVPPLVPTHDQDQVPFGIETGQATVPCEQRFVVGFEENVSPLAAPQEPPIAIAEPMLNALLVAGRMPGAVT